MLDEMPAPAFPVYGLAETYSGERWAATWNRLWTPGGPLWMVMLDHGDAGSLSRIGVVTDAKLGQQATKDGPVGPTGLDDALRWALLEMVVMATPLTERDSLKFQDAVARAGNGSSGFDTSRSAVEVDDVMTTVTVGR